MKRLRAAADWLGAGALLQKACAKSAAPTGRRLRVDGSSISRPGSAGTDWRVHATYEPALARFTHLEISDVRGGESFLRVPLRQGDIVVGDRAYARAPSLEKVVSAGADFIVRTGWTSVRLTTPDGQRVDWNAIYEPMQPGEVCEINVLVEHSGRKGRGKRPCRQGSSSSARMRRPRKRPTGCIVSCVLKSLNAMLMVMRPGKILTRVTEIIRHVCDPPRRRKSQSAAARSAVLV